LYRSAQPDWWGYDDLSLMGVKTVVQLNAGDFGFREPEHNDLKFVRYAMKVEKPYDFQVREIVDIIDNKLNEGSVLTHCTYGRDRTGLICAAFRIIKEGWSYAEAYDEMEKYSGSRLSKAAYFDQDFVKYLYTLYSKEITKAVPVESSTGDSPATDGPSGSALVPLPA